MKKVRQYIAMAAAALMITSIAPVNVTTYADEVTDTAIENNQIIEDESSEELNQISEINSSDSNVVVTNVDENSAYVEVNNATPGFSHIAISYTAKNDPEDCGTKILTGATSGIIDGLKSNTEYEVKAYQINVHVGSNHVATSTSTYLGTTSFKTASEINS